MSQYLFMNYAMKKTSNTIEKRMISLVLMSLTFCIFCKTNFSIFYLTLIFKWFIIKLFRIVKR